MNKKNIFICSIIVIVIIAAIVGIINFKNKEKMNYKLEVVTEINYVVFSENNKFGVINKNGEIVVDAQYDEVQIPNPSKPLFICIYGFDNEKNQHKIKVLNEKKEQILYQYVNVEAIKLNPAINKIPYEKSVLKFMKNGKYGLIDFNGKVIAKEQYDEINALDYKEGLLVVRKNGKYGVININGATVINIKYDSIEADGYYEDGSNYEKAGFIVGNKSGNDFKYGYIDYKGKQILANKYNQIERITNVTSNNRDIYLVAFENNKAGFFINNKNILKNQYEDISYDSNNNCLILQESSQQGVSDLNGNIKIDIKYNNIFVCGKYINAQKDDLVDIYNYENMEKINIENVVGLSEIENSNYSIAITNEDKYKIYDNQKNEVISNEYDFLDYYKDELFIASKEQKYGIIDINGNDVVEFKYDFIQKIENTQVVQALSAQENIIDLIVGKEIISSMKDCDIYVKENYIIHQCDTDFKYISYSGNILKNTDIFDKQLYAYEKNNKWGFANKKEEIIIEPEYDIVTEFNENGFAGIKKDGKWGVINLDGKIIIEPTYIIKSNNPEFIGKYYKYDLGYGNPYYICSDL